MNTEPSVPPRLRPHWQICLTGILLGDAVIGVMYGGGMLLIEHMNLLTILGLPSLLLVPMLGGLIASYGWRSLKPTMGTAALNTLWMTLLALILAAAFFHEGAICLLILSPIFYSSVLTGALLGRIWFKSNPTRLQVSLLPLLALGILAEPITRVDKERAITDEIIIHAPPSKVWPQLTSFPRITAPPRFWLFRLGLPYPVSTTSAGDFVNADRQCIFSHDAVFREKVIELVTAEKLTFEIVESPHDPELVGHLSPHRGQFVLRGNADGTTTLTGSTWYTLQVRPLWYFDLWTHHIFRAVHLRVMEDIRRRAESSF